MNDGRLLYLRGDKVAVGDVLVAGVGKVGTTVKVNGVIDVSVRRPDELLGSWVRLNPDKLYGLYRKVKVN